MARRGRCRAIDAHVLSLQKFFAAESRSRWEGTGREEQEEGKPSEKVNGDSFEVLRTPLPKKNVVVYVKSIGKNLL